MASSKESLRDGVSKGDFWVIPLQIVGPTLRQTDGGQTDLSYVKQQALRDIKSIILLFVDIPWGATNPWFDIRREAVV